MSPAVQSKALHKALRETFGIQSLRGGQQAVIDSVLARRNTLAIMPTGAGKSLCYQLPGMLLRGATIVVSPLISLMKDQVDKLGEAGVGAAQVNSTLAVREEAAAIDDIAKARREFVFVTPERLTDAQFVRTLKQSEIDLFVIDEAHCISQWGHDFRPAFLEIGAAIRALGSPPVLALTATATGEVIEDIGRQLGLADLNVINTGIYRDNLHYAVTHTTNPEEKIAQALSIVRQVEGTGIIYAATVKNVKELHKRLREAGVDGAMYHGQMTARERKESQEAFMDGRSRVMVATNAFGMGIDKPDVRFVLHHQMPANLEAYYQESGRAGRDGKPSRCVLLYDLQDKRVHQFFMSRRYPAVDQIGKVHGALAALGAADKPLGFDALRETLADVPAGKLQVTLKLLQDHDVIRRGRGRTFRLLQTELDAARIEELGQRYHERAEHDRDMLERMVFYAQTGFCRWRVLLEYFDEGAGAQDCGKCDNCVDPPEQRYATGHRHVHAHRQAPADDAAPAYATQPAAWSDTAATRSEPGEAAAHEHVPALVPQQPVSVPRYGEGRVVAVSAERVSIVFPDGQTRDFLTEFVAPMPTAGAHAGGEPAEALQSRERDLPASEASTA